MDPTDPVDENAVPVAFGGSADAIEDTVLRGDLPAAEDPDGDPLVYSKQSDAANGRVTVASDGGFVYTPDPDFFGLDAFDFSVSDGRGGVAVQTMSILVEAVDDVPVLVTATPDQSAFAGQAFLLALPQGAFYAYPNLSGLVGVDLSGRTASSTLELADLVLEEAKVAFVPGEAFGTPGYGRFSFALGDDDLVEGIERLGKLVTG